MKYQIGTELLNYFNEEYWDEVIYPKTKDEFKQYLDNYYYMYDEDEDDDLIKQLHEQLDEKWDGEDYYTISTFDGAYICKYIDAVKHEVSCYPMDNIKEAWVYNELVSCFDESLSDEYTLIEISLDIKEIIEEDKYWHDYKNISGDISEENKWLISDQLANLKDEYIDISNNIMDDAKWSIIESLEKFKDEITLVKGITLLGSFWNSNENKWYLNMQFPVWVKNEKLLDEILENVEMNNEISYDVIGKK